MTDAIVPPLRMSVEIERFPIAGSFTISRGSRTEAVVVTVVVEGHGTRGRGECVPYLRYGETPEAVVAALECQAEALAAGGRHIELVGDVVAVAGRNALDCALWDWRAKSQGMPAWGLLGLPQPQALTTCYTISLGDPATMEAAAARAADRPLLKVKLGGERDDLRIAAVRRGAPQARLVVDANESWTPHDMPLFVSACADAGVELIEQPLPAEADGWLESYRSPVPLCADESVHGIDTLERVCTRYDAINIKLDKTGGLTDALALARTAKERGLSIMVGCMLGTSLGMAPAMLLAHFADYVDLDAPLLLARDRDPGLSHWNSQLQPPPSALWG